MPQGKSALIAGSTQGLGYAMAARLAAEGCSIMLNGFGDGQEIDRKRRAPADRHGVRVLHHGADLADPGEIAALVEAAQQSFGTVDILINRPSTGRRAASCRRKALPPSSLCCADRPAPTLQAPPSRSTAAGVPPDFLVAIPFPAS